MPDNFFGLSFKGAAGAPPPSMAPDDPEIQKLLWKMRAPQDEVVTPPVDPYEGKGFGRQFVQALKDDLTGGVANRQRGYDNQVQQVQLRNAATRLKHEQEGLGYEARRTAVDEQNSGVAKARADRINAAIDGLTTPEKQRMATLNPGAMERRDFLTEAQYRQSELEIANVKNQVDNFGFFGPSGLHGPQGQSLEERFAGQQPQPGSAAPSRSLMAGLRPSGQAAGPGPLSASFGSQSGAAAPAPRRELGGSMTPIVLGQPVNPFDPKSKMMAGGVVPNPDAGSLYRDTAKGTVERGPFGYETMGNIRQNDEQWHPNPGGELTANQKVMALARLQTNWDQASKDYREIKQQEGYMQSGMEAARKGNLAQGAQAVLVTFQKILDPTSVVRESEYARSGAGLALLAQIEGYKERLISGGANVPLAELEKFAELGREFLRNADSGLSGRRTRLEKTADAWGVDKTLIFDSDAGKAQAADPPRPPGVPLDFVFTRDADNPGGYWKKPGG